MPPLLVALCTPELWSRTRVLLGTPEDPAREQLLALWLCHWCHPLPFPSWMGTVPLEPCPVWLERLQASSWTHGDDSALMEGSPSATGTRVMPLGMGGSSREDGSGVAWLWGCTPGSLLFVLGLAPGSRGAWPQDPGLSWGWPVRAPLGPAWLGSARSRIPSRPYMEIFPAAGRARCSPESCPGLGAEGLGEPGQPVEQAGPGGAAGSFTSGNPSASAPHSSWISQPVPTDATPLGSPPCEGPPHPFPQHRQGPSACWAGVSDPSAPRGCSGGLPTCPQLRPGMGERPHIPLMCCSAAVAVRNPLSSSPPHFSLSFWRFSSCDFFFSLLSLPSSGIASHAALTAEVTQTC